MTSLFSMLVVMLAGMFWVLRVIVAVTGTLDTDFAIQALNQEIEIALLFVTLLALILVIRRNMIGALIYLVSYLLYFGVDLYRILARGNIQMADYGSMFISVVAILIAFLVFVDVSLSKDVKKGGGNKKTNWFYGTDEYVREKDGTEDENQYKL